MTTGTRNNYTRKLYRGRPEKQPYPDPVRVCTTPVNLGIHEHIEPRSGVTWSVSVLTVHLVVN